MNAWEIMLIAPMAGAGVLIATLATVACSREWARHERDRQIFRAYLDHPENVESWLTEGAIGELKRVLSESEGRRPAAMRDQPAAAM